MLCIWWQVDQIPALVLAIGAKSPLEYDTKSDLLNMDAQKDAQGIHKALKISGFISPMLHLIPETESENNLVRFLLCIDFNAYSHLGIAEGFANGPTHPTLEEPRAWTHFVR